MSQRRTEAIVHMATGKATQTVMLSSLQFLKVSYSLLQLLELFVFIG